MNGVSLFSQPCLATRGCHSYSLSKKSPVERRTYLSVYTALGLGGPATHRRHTHVELPTTLLIVKMVFQSNGEIKEEKERGAEVGGSGGLNVILNDLRFTDSNVLACFLSAGTERKQSASVKQEH